MKNNLENIFISGFNSKYIGDDGAVIDGLIYSNDAFFENVHFKRDWMSLEQIGYKAMITNISDAVAMNAVPKYALLSIALPNDFDSDDVLRLQKGIKEACEEFGVEVIGGDTIANVKLDISVTIISKSENPLLRSGIKEGDLLAFTGTLGQSLKGLHALQNGARIEADSRFIKPTLRSDFIYSSRVYLNAGMDISDGLFFELERLSKINNIGFEFLTQIPEEIGCSGEEYEMLIAFAPEKLQQIKSLADISNTELTVFAKAITGSFECECKAWHF